MKRLTVICAAAFYAALLIMTPLAHAQGITGTISGSVRDGSGAVIPGATVTLTSESQGIKSPPVPSSERGDFVFPNVTADTYTIEVELPSFKTAKRTGVAVSPGSIMNIGAVTL